MPKNLPHAETNYQLFCVVENVHAFFITLLMAHPFLENTDFKLPSIEIIENVLFTCLMNQP
jgi:hypothetical protein